MATAKKTASGMWKVRVYSHTTPDGKKHYRAFTAPLKAEAEQMASNFSGSADRAARCDLTVQEAVSGYIKAKEAVLSPSTIRGYYGQLNNYFDLIGVRRIQRLTTKDVQMWIADLTGRVSPKTVSNVYGLFTAAVGFYLPDKAFRGVKLPPKKKKRPVAPSDEQVQMLYKEASPNLKKAIALEAFASMRRSEVCALTYGDIKEHSYQLFIQHWVCTFNNPHIINLTALQNIKCHICIALNPLLPCLCRILDVHKHPFCKFS